MKQITNWNELIIGTKIKRETYSQGEYVKFKGTCGLMGSCIMVEDSCINSVGNFIYSKKGWYLFK